MFEYRYYWHRQIGVAVALPDADLGLLTTAPTSSGTMAAPADDVPLLVRVLAGNPVTSAAILGCLNTVDASHLRQVTPVVANVVAGVPWADMGTAVVDVVRWRAAFPSAVGVWISKEPAGGGLTPPALAALAGVTQLGLLGCGFVTDELLLHLPASLSKLNVSYCRALTGRASFVHLTELTVLHCLGTLVVAGGVAGLPASLQELEIGRLPVGVSLAGLTRLQVLRAMGSELDAVTLASLPPCLLELDASYCKKLAPGASFAHLPALRKLGVSNTAIDDTSLASMPPSLVSLTAYNCYILTLTTVLPPLPALRLLDVSNTGVGDALVASLPAGLTELRLVDCHSVTAGATLDHVPALRMLQSYGTDLAPGVLDACRARGCAVYVAAGVLRGHDYHVRALAPLADGRLASRDMTEYVRIWNVAADGGETGVVLDAGIRVCALAALRGGVLLATGLWRGRVEIWDVGILPPARTATITCSDSDVRAIAVLLNGRLATGCDDGEVQIIDDEAGTGAVVATLEGHNGKVTALAVLPDGTLASGSWDDTVRLWDVGAQMCIATLTGHSGDVNALAVLADGRLASGSDDTTVLLWDVSTRTCVGVLVGHSHIVSALAALPDGRLVSGSYDGTVRVWDTRPIAAAAGSHAAGTAPAVVIARGIAQPALVPLPDGRLACSHERNVYLLHVPPPAVYE